MHPYPSAKYHFWYPLLLGLLAWLGIQLGQLDLRLADFWYQLQGPGWPWRDAWWSAGWIHQGGRWLSGLGYGLLVLAALWSFWRPQAAAYRQTLAYLLWTVAGSSLLVSLLKRTFQTSCVWDLSRYGGQYPYRPLLTELLHPQFQQHCFPAGHASAGYAWVALYFAGLYWRSDWRWAGLALGLSLGLIFGITQQLRGAHFLSHDLASLACCWGFALCSVPLFFRPAAVEARPVWQGGQHA